MKITWMNRLLQVKYQAEESDQVVLEGTYEHEDILVFELTEDEQNRCKSRVKITVDKTLLPAEIFMPSGKLMYQMPSGWKRKAYDSEAFEGHGQVSMAMLEESQGKTRRNLALNSMDVRGETIDYFPHAEANVVTRDEPWFEARNVIDGYKETDGHGPYPYQSWGGGLREDLELRIYFGRPVRIDEVVLYLRADYKDDHDVNWESGVLVFSDGEEMPLKLAKTTEGQAFRIKPKVVEWIKLNRLKREVSAAFSALTQLEVYGWDLMDEPVDASTYELG